jgi:hypothetical protein
MNRYNAYILCAVTGGIVGGALVAALMASIVLARRYLKYFKTKLKKVVCFTQLLIYNTKPFEHWRIVH